MDAGTKGLLVIVILLVGVVAALPFQRDSAPTELSSQEKDEGKRDKPGYNVLLKTQNGESPTQNLFSPRRDTNKIQSIRPGSLESLDPPPNFNSEFPAESPASGDTSPSSSSTHSGATAERTHIIGKNETLYDIAKRFWGSGDLYLEIYKANLDVLLDPNDLPVGRKIVIPDLPGKKPTVKKLPADDAKLVPIQWK